MKKLIIFPIVFSIVMFTAGILMLSGVNISNPVRANNIVSASSESRMEIDIVETGETSTGQSYLALLDGFELSNLVGFWGGISLTIEISSTDYLIFVFEPDTAYGFVMRDFETTTPNTPAYDVDRVYVAGNELIVKEKSSQEFRFDITGATQVKTNFYEEIGKTKGYGSLHLSDETFKSMQEFLRENNIVISNKFGEGPNWRMRVIHTACDLLGINAEILLNHSFKRNIYCVALAKNYKEYLSGTENTIDYIDMPMSSLVNYWKSRWLEKRKKYLFESGELIELINFNPCNFSII